MFGGVMAAPRTIDHTPSSSVPHRRSGIGAAVTSPPGGGPAAAVPVRPSAPPAVEPTTRSCTRPLIGNGGLHRGGSPRLYVEASTGPGGTVFLHGLGGTARYWQVEEGAGHLPADAVLVDLYGFGRSPRPFRPYTLDAHLSALEPVVAEHAPTVLVGHSLGAALALAYAARRPAEVRGLVLIGLPSYGGPEGARRWFRPAPRGWFLTNMALSAVACVATRRLLGPFLPLILRDVPPQVARDLVEHNAMSSTTSLWNVLYRHDPADDLERLPARIPVLFIHGADDTTAPVEAVRRLAARRPGSRLLVLPGVDHHPWLRVPETCAAVIGDWKTEVVSAPHRR